MSSSVILIKMALPSAPVASEPLGLTFSRQFLIRNDWVQKPE